MEGLEVLHRLLRRHQLAGELQRRLLVLGGLGRVSRALGLVGQHESLPGRALELFDLTHLTGELHLELALVADDSGGLLGELRQHRLQAAIDALTGGFGANV